jgi:hypothetical protein
MKRYFYIISGMSLLFLLTTVAQQLAIKPTGSPEAELSKLETEWNNAHLRSDADALDRLCADDLSVTVPGMAVMAKSDAIGVLRSGHLKFSRYETFDTRIRVYPGAAVVVGELQRTRTMMGRSMNDDWLFTKNYARINGKWQVVAFHASENVQPPAAVALSK